MSKITSTLAVVLIIMLGKASEGFCSQWQLKIRFGSEISCVKFISPTVGFVGLGVAPGGKDGIVGIYKTTDGGATWTQSTIPVNYLGSVTQILMVDGVTGWATITPSNSQGNKGLWSTKDGGVTWEETELVGVCSSISLTKAGMIITDLTGLMHISTDGGNTFFTGSPNWTNDVVFADSLHGVISNFRDASWFVSADGGLSWNRSNLVVEAWSVYALANTHTYYAAPEGWTNGGTWVAQVLRSTNDGLDWTTMSKIPFLTNGHITGIGEKILYLQTFSQSVNPGLYHSLDQGKTWSLIGGPKSNDDVRFDVVDHGCEGVAVWAFDQSGGLFEFMDTAIASGGNLAQASSSVIKNGIPLDAVDIPVHVKLSALPIVDSMKITSIDFSVIYGSDLLDMNQNRLASQIKPASGLSFGSATIMPGRLATHLENPTGLTLTNDIYLGDLFFTAYAGTSKSTLVQLSGFTLNTTNGSHFYCTGAEGDFLARVTVDGSSLVLSELSMPETIQPNPVRSGGTMNVRLHGPTGSIHAVTFADVLGREVAIDYRSELSKDDCLITVRLPTKVAQGSYFLRVEIGGSVRTQKVICTN